MTSEFETVIGTEEYYQNGKHQKHISKDGSISWRIRVRGANYDHHNTFRTKKEAETWAKEIELDVHRNPPFPSPKMNGVITFSFLCNKCIQDILPTKAPRTQSKQTQILNWWMESLARSYWRAVLAVLSRYLNEGGLSHVDQSRTGRMLIAQLSRLQ